MTFVVTESCIKCKYTDCVEVCPVDCFYEGPNFWLFILKNALIVLCEPECPVNAIVSEDDLTPEQQQFKELNAKLAKNWPNITSKRMHLQMLKIGKRLRINFNIYKKSGRNSFTYSIM